MIWTLETVIKISCKPAFWPDNKCISITQLMHLTPFPPSPSCTVPTISPVLPRARYLRMKKDRTGSTLCRTVTAVLTCEMATELQREKMLYWPDLPASPARLCGGGIGGGGWNTRLVSGQNVLLVSWQPARWTVIGSYGALRIVLQSEFTYG